MFHGGSVQSRLDTGQSTIDRSFEVSGRFQTIGFEAIEFEAVGFEAVGFCMGYTCVPLTCTNDFNITSLYNTRIQ